MFVVTTRGPHATQELAATLAGILEHGDVVVLSGDLGAGKTCFVQGLARGLGITEPVTSPTFTLVQSYDGRLRLHHVDVYRLDHAAELRDLGLPELLDEGAVVAVEWGEMVLTSLGRDHLLVRLRFDRTQPGDPDYVADPDSRRVELHLSGPSWTSRNPGVRAAVQAVVGSGEGA